MSNIIDEAESLLSDWLNGRALLVCHGVHPRWERGDETLQLARLGCGGLQLTIASRTQPVRTFLVECLDRDRDGNEFWCPEGEYNDLAAAKAALEDLLRDNPHQQLRIMPA